MTQANKSLRWESVKIVALYTLVRVNKYWNNEDPNFAFSACNFINPQHSLLLRVSHVLKIYKLRKCYLTILFFLFCDNSLLVLRFLFY